MRFAFRSLAIEDADAMLSWRYEPPYDEYDPSTDPSDAAEIRAAVGDATWFAVDDADTGELAGFLDCRPRPDADEVEIGLGLHPGLTGRGIGPPFVEAIVALIRERWDPGRVTLDVLPWNERAIVAYERAGFVRGEVYDKTFEDGNVRTFLRMTRSLR